MISNQNRFVRGCVCALLLLSFLSIGGCNGSSAQPEKPVAPTEPPPDLDWAEGWQPYPQGVQPVGNAELVPGYEPMRKGVATMKEELKQMLLEQGLQINTARTVVLPETATSSTTQNLEQVTNTHLVQISDLEYHNCMFRQDCSKYNKSMQNSGSFLLEGTSGQGGINTWATTPGEPGTAAEGLYGYIYWLGWQFAGDPTIHCVNSFSIDFGPVALLDYNGNGTPDLGFFHGPTNPEPSTVEQKENTLTFHYDPPICDGLYNLYFSLTSAYPPREVEMQIQDINGVTYPLKSLAPAYPQNQTIEETNPSQSAVFGAGNIPLNFVDVKEPEINCVFNLNCDRNWNADSGSKRDFFTLAGTDEVGTTDGTGSFLSLVRTPGEPGTPAERLYGYQYDLDLRGILGDPEVHCIESFSIEFGPVTPIDYNSDGMMDYGYVYNLGEYDYDRNAPLGSRYVYKGDFVRKGRPAAVEQKGNTLTFFFDPVVCVGTDAYTNEGDLSFVIGLTSAYPPRLVDYLIQDKNLTKYLVYKGGLAPDYPQEQGFQETVSIAPVVATEDPNAYDQAKLQEMFRTEGVVIGMLTLETNAPDSVIPSGTYLERAYLDGDKGVVELIEVTSGQVVYKVDLLAKTVEDSSLIIPSASIFIGSKTCLTCLWGWYICRDCFFWEADQMELEECERILSTITPTP